MISPFTVQKILDTTRVEDVLADFLTLKRRGSNLMANCPFHNEKSPSFSVSPSKGIYKCFGCGVVGNSITFLMEHEKLTYPDSLRYLAKKYNIEIEEVETSEESKVIQSQIDGLYIVLQYAAEQFERNLWETEEGKTIGYSYFKERGFSDEIIKKFQLGYSINEWSNFSDEAIKKGYSMDNLVKAGLTKVSEAGKHRDFYKGRVVFPIHNLSSKVIGFGGRILVKADNAPKYINTPESEVYHKSHVLYGMFQARKAIRTEDYCLLVEGYTDVVSMHQGGIENVVASSGTSLTVDQIKLIKKFTENIIILYDGDAAGVKAALRGLELVLEQGMNLKMVLLPDNEDPDSYIRKEGAANFKAFIEKNAADFILFKTRLILEDVKNDPIKKSEFIQDIIDSIAKIPDTIKRSLYIKECSTILNIQEQLVINEVQKKKRKEYYDKNKIDAEGKQILEQIAEPEKEEQVFNTTKTSAFYASEREICRILLESGNELKAETEIKIADYIFKELEDHEMKTEEFKPLYSYIKSLYEQHLIMDLNYYLHNEEKSISTIAMHLTASKYELANWNNKGVEMELPKWNEFFSRDIELIIARYKLLRINELIEENRQLLKNAEDNKNEEDLKMRMEMGIYLINLKKELAKITNIVIE